LKGLQKFSTAFNSRASLLAVVTYAGSFVPSLEMTTTAFRKAITIVCQEVQHRNKGTNFTVDMAQVLMTHNKMLVGRVRVVS
jgi:hypothetical protein